MNFNASKRGCCLTFSLLLTASGCAPDYERSATYAADSALVDSIARTIPTDSLFSLSRQTLFAEDYQAAAQAAACELVRLEFRYGLYPALVAKQRMTDTLWIGIHPDTFATRIARWPAGVLIHGEPSECGLPADAEMPETPEVDLSRF